MTRDHDSSPPSLRVDARGRIVLPADIRRDLHVRQGDRLIVQRPEPGVVQLMSVREAARRLRGALKPHTGGRSLVDELIEERRRESEA